MSRTDGIHLPRVPTGHIRVTSSDAVQHHPKKGKHASSLSEPHYTAYIGTPRQDVPGQVYRDAAMFDDVFDRQGRLLTGRNTPKIISPLNSLEYNSLHDPHCQQLFLNNVALRNHLISLGLLTDDLRVVANTRQQIEKVRSHELLERKETLLKKLDERERQRKERLQKQVRLPAIYQESLAKEEARKARYYMIERKKLEKQRELQKIEKKKESEKKQEKKKRLQEVLEQIKLIEQIQRNTAVYEQQQAEIDTYQKKYGKTAVWHRESDKIHNRMVHLQRMKWSTGNKKVVNDKYKTRNLQNIPSSAGEAEMEDSTPSKSPAHTDEQDDKTRAEEMSQHEYDTVEQDHEVLPSPTEVKGAVQSDTTDSEDIRPPEAITTTSDSEPQPLKEVTADETIVEEVQPLDRTNKDSDLGGDDTNTTAATMLTTMSTLGEDGKTRSEAEASENDTNRSNSKSRSVVRQITLTGKVPFLSQQESLTAVTNVFFDILQQYDTMGTGYIEAETFFTVMKSPDLALPLDEDELLILTSQVNDNGWVPLEQATALLPSLLIDLFQDRLSRQIDEYNKYIEDRWLQLSSPNMGYIYLDKTTGYVQRDVRPPDYRPYLKNDLFEDIIVEFFERADVNRDGYVDSHEVYMFFQSPDLYNRLYVHQIDELHKVFIDQSVERVMTLEQFVPFAHVILQMIYSNSYPNDEWVELESRKCGKYFFNPSTGETKLPDELTKKPGTAETPKRKSRSRRRRRESKDTTTTPKPPPLRKKSSITSTKTTEVEEIRIEPVSREVAEGKTSRPSSSKEHEEQQQTNSDGDNETSIAEQVADKLQKGLRIIETIEEEEDNEEHVEKQQSDDPTEAAKDVREREEESVDTERDSIDSAIDRVMEKVLNEKLSDDD